MKCTGRDSLLHFIPLTWDGTFVPSHQDIQMRGHNIIFLICHQNHMLCPSSEPSQDGSDEGSQHYVFMQNKQKLSQIITKYSLLSRAVYRLSHLSSSLHSKVKTMPFLARLDEVQEELLYYPRRWHWCRHWQRLRR